MNNLSNYLGALALAKLLAATGLPDWAVTLINIAVLTPILFVFAETLPKEVFRTRAEVLAYALCPILTTVRRILTVLGIVPVILFITGFAERLLGGKPIQTDSGERVRAILQEAEGAGVLSQEQADTPRPRSRLRHNHSRRRDDALGRRPQGPRLGHHRPGRRQRRQRRPITLPPARPPRPPRRHRLRIRPAPRRKRNHGTTRATSLRQPVTIDQATEVPKALAILSEAGSPIAIVTAKSKPVGIVTVKDLVEPLTGDLSAW
jgi:putative hemolysin